MNYSMRRDKILELLAEYEFVSKEQIKDALGASISTVQRDFLAMEQEHLLVRVWGGAKRNENGSLYKRKIEERSPTKGMLDIGEIAADRVNDGELIFIGAGKTTLAMAKQITARNITVITNGIPQLEVLSKRNVNVFLLCGFFKEYSHSVIGRQTTDMLSSYRIDKAFLGTKGIDSDFCPISGDEYEYDIKRICIRNAGETYVLADYTKFNRTAMYVTPSEETKHLNYITDQRLEYFSQFKPEKHGYIWERRDQ